MLDTYRTHDGQCPASWHHPGGSDFSARPLIDSFLRMDPKRPVFSWLLHDSWENTLKPGTKQYVKFLNITMEWGLSFSLHISSSSHRGGNTHQLSSQPHSNVLGRDFSRLAPLSYLLFSEKLSHWGDYHKLKFKCVVFPFFFGCATGCNAGS